MYNRLIQQRRAQDYLMELNLLCASRSDPQEFAKELQKVATDNDYIEAEIDKAGYDNLKEALRGSPAIKLK